MSEETIEKEYRDIGRAGARIAHEIGQRARNGTTLVVALGEEHRTAAHMTTQMLVTKTLKNKGYTLACGIERPANYLTTQFYKSVSGHSDEKRVMQGVANLARLAPDHPIHLKTSATAEWHFAKQSHNIRDCFLLQENVSTRFLDLGRDTDRDLQTDPQEMARRNRIMASHATDHIRHRKPDIYIIFCGAAHVAGNRKYAFEDSLTARFNQRKQSFLGISFGSWIDWPLQSWTSKDTIVSPVEGQKFEHMQQDEERVWLQTMLPRIFPGSALLENIEDYQKSCDVTRRQYFQAALALAGKFDSAPALKRAL